MSLKNWNLLENLDEFEVVWEEFREAAVRGLSTQPEAVIRDQHAKFAVLKAFYSVKKVNFAKEARIKKPMLKIIEAKQASKSGEKTANKAELAARITIEYSEAVEEAGRLEGWEIYWGGLENAAESAMIALSRELSVRLKQS